MLRVLTWCYVFRKCPRCKCHRNAVKSLGIWRLPPVLIIHLKRFTFDGPFRDKLQTLVTSRVAVRD